VQDFESFSGAEAGLLETASSRTGLDDFGEPSFREGLRQLLAALDAGVPRSPAARAACQGVVVQHLTGRLYAQAGWNRRPETLAKALPRPVFIVGAPRTGTTALHLLLAADPAWQGLESWLTFTPMPRPPRAAWMEHPEYAAAAAASEARLKAQPELKSIHYVGPGEVDECLRITGQTFCSNVFGSVMSVPRYDAWFRAQDFRPVYRLLADNMRLIGADEPDRRWLLKNPSHLLNLEELLEVFPDASVIHTHRDPLTSFPSFWSLVSRHQRALDEDNWTPRRNPDRELALWGEALNRSVELQRRHPGRILDVYEADIAARPMELAAEIYDFVGQPLTSEARQAMAGRVADNPKGKHGAHRYALADFQSTPEEVAGHVGPYRAHHGFDARRPVPA